MANKELGKTSNEEDGQGDLIQKAMGDFGWSQIIICSSLSLLKVSVAWHQLAILFLAPPVEFWCENPSDNISTSDWRNISSPAADWRRSCGRYDQDVDKLLLGDIGNGSTVPCSRFEFDTSVFTSTIIDEWQLVCSREMLAHLAQTIFMFGILVGSFSFGFIADKYGRKNPMLWSIAFQVAAGVGTAFTTNFILFLVLRFIDAVATGGAMVTSFVICMEIVGSKQRSLVSVLYHIPFSFGHFALPGISYLLRDWRHFQLAISVPSVLLLSYYWFVPESPRWLLASGRASEAENIIRSIAKNNGLPQDGIKDALQEHCENKLGGSSADNKASFLDLLRYPNLRKKTLSIGFNWIVCGVCFFGLAQFMGQIDGNIFLNVAVGGMIEVPGTICCVYLLEKLGRKKTLMLSQAIAAISCLSVIFVPEGIIWPTVTLGTIGIVSMSIAFPTLYLYSGELFPTVVRNVGVGFSSMCARIGSMAAPFISSASTYGTFVPPLIFAIFPFVGCLLCLMLPETKGVLLPDTIEEGEFDAKKPRATGLHGEINPEFFRQWKEGSKL